MTTTEVPQQRSYPCPQCLKDLAWDVTNRFRPFCSERCQQVDFGEWTLESYSIAGEEEASDVSSSHLEP